MMLIFGALTIIKRRQTRHVIQNMLQKYVSFILIVDISYTLLHSIPHILYNCKYNLWSVIVHIYYCKYCIYNFS